MSTHHAIAIAAHERLVAFDQPYYPPSNKDTNMLVLTRRIGENLIINHNIKISTLGIKGNQVRFGITAPREVDVHREEVYQKILKQKEQERENA